MKSRRSLIKKTILAVGIVLMVVSPIACGTTSGSFCDARCDCEGCSESEYEHCEIGFEHDDDHASLHGCEDSWGTYLDCVESEGACNGKDFDDGCKGERERYKNCADH